MFEVRTEIFQGYCPTQDKWEKVEQTYIDVSELDSKIKKYVPYRLTCPHISFRNEICKLFDQCPVVKGEWTSESPNVFIALQFNTPEGSPRKIVDNVIKPVCSEFGLEAFIASDIEHNGSIYETILKSISKSRFIIADLTYSNNGAYYEAGYAKGLGKMVIHTCLKEWLNKVHFDVKGLNLILYENDKDFIDKLRKRIRENINK